MDKKKGIIVLLIALVAVWFLFLRSTCVSDCEDATACEASDVHGCDGHDCETSKVHGCNGHKCEDSCNKSVNVLSNEDNNGDNIQNKTQILETLRKTPLFYAKAKEFEFHLDNKSGSFSIISVVISADMSTDTSRQRTCDEISKSIAGEKIVFNSGEESQSSEETIEVYRLKQKGEITLGENKFSADFYFNGESKENITSFHGKIIFAMPSIESLNGEKVIIEVKGKK